MLQNKIEDALVNKFIAKIIFSENTPPIYAVFTGRIKVLNEITDTQVTSTYRYYLKEVDIDEYEAKKDINKALRSLRTLMHEQIKDIEESGSIGFSNTRNFT